MKLDDRLITEAEKQQQQMHDTIVELYEKYPHFRGNHQDMVTTYLILKIADLELRLQGEASRHRVYGGAR